MLSPAIGLSINRSIPIIDPPHSSHLRSLDAPHSLVGSAPQCTDTLTVLSLIPITDR